MTDNRDLGLRFLGAALGLNPPPPFDRIPVCVACGRIRRGSGDRGEDGMRLIALDIDGVLNSTRYWYHNGPLPMGQAGAIDPAAVARLNAIIAATGALVVLSSSWRTQGVERVAAMLRERGFTGEIIGATPVKIGCPRSAEIMEWLARFPFADVRCAILDDDADAWDEDGIEGARYFATNYQVGLTDEHVPLVVEWLTSAAASQEVAAANFGN